MKRRKRIAVLMAGLIREYQQAFAWGMAESCRELDVDLCIFTCQGAEEPAFYENERIGQAIFDLPELDDFDGIAALCSTVASPQGRRNMQQLLIRHKNKPQVMIDDALPHAIHVGFDDAGSLREVTEHLLEHGYDSYAIVSGPRGNPVADHRLETCREVLREHGIEVEEDCLIDGGWRRSGGTFAARQLLERGKPLPRAIICGNDDMALGMIEVLEKHGVRIPEDVAMIGFDATREALGRGLTSVRRPVRMAGAKTVQLLVDWMNGIAPKEHDLIIPTQMILGGSCGCKPNIQLASSYVRILSNERRSMEKSLLQTSSFSSSLAGVASMPAAGEVINRFAMRWDMEQLHVCVSPNFLEPPKGEPDTHYPDTMLLLSSFAQGQMASQVEFPTRQLVPILEEERDYPLAVAFCPVYYLERIFGYTVLDLQFATTLVLYPLIATLSGALTNLSLQATVRAYANAIRENSLRDPLTGLYNRRYLMQVGPEMVTRARNNGQLFVILSADMDDMKFINDRFGHMAGDRAISRMGEALRALAGPEIECIHISGDEFLVIGLVKERQTAENLLTQLMESIARVNRDDPWLYDITASAGLYAAVPREDSTLDDYMVLADRRMYQCKDEHKRRASLSGK